MKQPILAFKHPKSAFLGGQGGSQNKFFIWMFIFLWVRSPCKILRSYDNPLCHFSNGSKKKKRKIPKIVDQKGVHTRGDNSSLKIVGLLVLWNLVLQSPSQCDGLCYQYYAVRLSDYSLRWNESSIIFLFWLIIMSRCCGSCITFHNCFLSRTPDIHSSLLLLDTCHEWSESAL